MHYSCLVAIPADTTADATEAAVAKLMAPFDENVEHDCPRCEENDWEGECAVCARTFWDWWQVGGRWTGYFATDYDPTTDPNNIESCFLCYGTGKRDDAPGRQARESDPSYSCNGCGGLGMSVKWATSWAPFPGDRVSHEFATRFLQACEHPPYRFVVAEQTGERETYAPDNPQGERFVETPNWREVVLGHVQRARGCDFVIIDIHS